MLDRPGNRSHACERCLRYQEPDSTLFTNTWIGKSRNVSCFYLVYRWLIAVTVSLFLIYSISNRDIFSLEWWKYFLYLTSWARMLSVLHYFSEAVLVTCRWRREHLSSSHVARSRLLSSYASTETRLPLWHKMMWALANINADIAALCTIVYWVFLFDRKNHPVDVDNISGHVLIMFINVVDVFVSQRPWRVLHVYQAQLFCLVYVISNFAYIEGGGTNLADQPYIYSILDWSQPQVCIVTILGVLLVLPLIHGIFILLYRLRCVINKVVNSRRSSKAKYEVELVESNFQLLRNQ